MENLIDNVKTSFTSFIGQGQKRSLFNFYFLFSHFIWKLHFILHWKNAISLFNYITKKINAIALVIS